MTKNTSDALEGKEKPIMKKIALILAALLLTVSFAIAEEVDTYTSASLTKSYVEGDEAAALAETLTAVVFVINHIRAAGNPLSTMGEAAKHFIANWESEKYRKSLAGKK